MRIILRALAVLLMLVAFMGVYGWASGWGVSGPNPRPTSEVLSQVVKRGNYGLYTYAIELNGVKNKIVVQFDPPLPADDGVVLPALKAVAQDGFGFVLAEGAQPVVEARDDANYITFVSGTKRVLIELFRNASGKVGSARMWTELLE